MPITFINSRVILPLHKLGNQLKLVQIATCCIQKLMLCQSLFLKQSFRSRRYLIEVRITFNYNVNRLTLTCLLRNKQDGNLFTVWIINPIPRLVITEFFNNTILDNIVKARRYHRIAYKHILNDICLSDHCAV